MKWYHNGGKHEDKLKAPNGSGTFCRGHYKITVDGRQRDEHVVIAEIALGKPLPDGAVVHHVNGIKHDNRPENLVICPNQSYHMDLHRRQKALGITFS